MNSIRTLAMARLNRESLASGLAVALAIGLAFGLAACGGGGGSSTGPSTGPVSMGPTAYPLTASNYQTVARSVIVNNGYFSDLGATLAAAETSSAPAVMPAAIKLVSTARKRLPGIPVTLGGAETRVTENCTGGGTIAIVLNDANNNNSLDTGDTFSMEMKACKEDGDTINGQITVVMQAQAGVYGSSNYSSTMQVTLSQFAVLSAGTTSTGSGSLTLTVTETPTATDTLIVAPNFSVSQTTPTSVTTESLSDLRISAHSQGFGASQSTTASIAFTYSGSSLDNKFVKVETPTPLVTMGASLYPSSGVLLIKGDANSQVRVTVLNSTQVKLELDANGDSTYETSVTKTWAELS